MALLWKNTVTDCVDAGVQSMESPGPQSHFHRLLSDPLREKLPPPHDSMLLLGQPRDPRVDPAAQPTSPLQPVHSTGKNGLV